MQNHEAFFAPLVCECEVGRGQLYYDSSKHVFYNAVSYGIYILLQWVHSG